MKVVNERIYLQDTKQGQWVVCAQTLPEFLLGRVFKVNIWLEGCGMHDLLLIGWW